MKKVFDFIKSWWYLFFTVAMIVMVVLYSHWHDKQILKLLNDGSSAPSAHSDSVVKKYGSICL